MPELNILYSLFFILVGIISGISMGIVGVGAGMITMPLLLCSGIDIKSAVGISLIMQLLPQSLPGVMMYYKNNYITKETILVSLYLIIGALLGTYAGARMVHSNYINEKMIYSALSIILLYGGLYIIYKHLL
jgi:uncharacterized protein